MMIPFSGIRLPGKFNAIHFLLDRIDGCPAGSQSHSMSCQENILGNCRQILYPEFLAMSLCHTGGISADKDEEKCLLDILCMIFIGFGIFLDILLVLQNHEMPWLHIVRCRCSHTGTEQGFYLGILHWLLLELSYACAGHDVLHHSLCAYIFLHSFLDASWKSGLTFPDFKLLSYICIPKVFFYVISNG
mgnify:CR=1 FL=1